MARATVLKRFELSPEAAAELEVEAQEGRTSQTAIVQAWLEGNLATRLAYQRTPAGRDEQSDKACESMLAQACDVNAPRLSVKPRGISSTTVACPHPSGNRTSGKNWKCTLCGYQHVSRSASPDVQTE